MAQPIGRDEDCSSTVSTSVWIEEHEALHRLFKSPGNSSPKFRFPDLLSACVSLVLGEADGQRQLIAYLTSRHLQRHPKTRRRSCQIFQAQFDQAMSAHRADWNRFPNPCFDLDQILTGCVLVALEAENGASRVLQRARDNLQARSVSDASQLN